MLDLLLNHIIKDGADETIQLHEHKLRYGCIVEKDKENICLVDLDKGDRFLLPRAAIKTLYERFFANKPFSIGEPTEIIALPSGIRIEHGRDTGNFYFRDDVMRIAIALTPDDVARLDGIRCPEVVPTGQNGCPPKDEYAAPNKPYGDEEGEIVYIRVDEMGRALHTDFPFNHQHDRLAFKCPSDQSMIPSGENVIYSTIDFENGYSMRHIGVDHKDLISYIWGMNSSYSGLDYKERLKIAYRYK